MFAPLTIGLSIAVMAIYLNVSSKEEIVKVTAAIVALVCLLISLVFSPLIIKIPIVAIVLMGNKFNASSEGRDARLVAGKKLSSVNSEASHLSVG
jgi:hypothetical protein